MEMGAVDLSCKCPAMIKKFGNVMHSMVIMANNTLSHI